MVAWVQLAVVVAGLRRRSLPEMTRRLSVPRRRASHVHCYPARRVSAVADRALRSTPYQPRCVLRALVVFSLLHRQGDQPELVIGLPLQAADKDAHAWLEIGGIDVGPPPGRSDHVELARY
jgi:Transglutaminase-like superfamily